MKPLDFEVWSEYCPDKYTPEGLLKLLTPEARLQIVEYHYNYLRLRTRIEELEEELAAANGKIYALQETIDGREPTVERIQLSGWPAGLPKK